MDSVSYSETALKENLHVLFRIDQTVHRERSAVAKTHGFSEMPEAGPEQSQGQPRDGTNTAVATCDYLTLPSGGGQAISMFGVTF